MDYHKYGPKGHIIDAFNAHLAAMTREDWEEIFNGYLCSDDAYVKNAAAMAQNAARIATGSMDWWDAAEAAPCFPTAFYRFGTCLPEGWLTSYHRLIHWERGVGVVE
mgnify:CR=1 FL=1